MTVRLPTLRSMALLAGLFIWFIVWLPGIIWFVNAQMGGRLSWWLIEASALLLYSAYATVEIVQSLVKRSEPQGPMLKIKAEPESMQQTVERLKEAGVIKNG